MTDKSSHETIGYSLCTDPPPSRQEKYIFPEGEGGGGGGGEGGGGVCTQANPVWCEHSLR